MSNSENRIERHYGDVEYYEAHYRELLNRYPDQWIAVRNRKVVGTSGDAFKLMANLKAEGVPTHEVLVRHLTRDAELLILAGR